MPLHQLKTNPYVQLMRFDKPIGTLLLLWPTWSALLLANDGLPSLTLFVVFTLGVIFMRAAGCVINDYADRKIDGQVTRTSQRPLATGAVSAASALKLFALLIAASAVLVLFTNKLTIMLAVIAAGLAITYPFMKRHTHLPQVVLGAAFSMGIVMAFAASTNAVPMIAWVFAVANLLWTVAYDTYYAMVDRDDDLKIGVKSTAVLFADQDLFYIACLQGLTLLCWLLVGHHYELSLLYWLCLAAAACLFLFQRGIANERGRDACFYAFLNNNYVGALLFVGILLTTSFN